MTSINWDFISSLEGKAVKDAYVPSDNSGVTIATGFDLKEKDADLLNQMGISEDTTNLLSQFFGMQGAEAKESSQGFSLNDDQVKEIDQASHNWYAGQVKRAYENGDHQTAWDDLTEAQRTVITSVGFQHGTSFKRKDGSEMNYIKQARANDWDSLLANLRNFGDDFNTRRNKEADYLESEKKIEPRQPIKDPEFVPTDITKQKDLFSELPDVSRGLFLDKAYNYSEYQKFLDEQTTFTEATKASIRENTIFANAFDLFFNKTFIQQDGFSYNNNKSEFEEIIKKYDLRGEFGDSIIEAVNPAHLDYLGQKAQRHQKNAEMLASLGWKGIALQFGTFLLDPVNLTGYGALSKVMKGTQFLTGISRRKNFVRSGLVYGSMEGALYSPIAANNPTMGLNDIIIASALGGTLGGAISAITSKSIKNVGLATQRADLIENGLAPTKQADKTKFKNVKHTLKNKKFTKEMHDVDAVDNIELAFGTARNIPFLGFAMTRSGSLGSSMSKLAKKFAFDNMEDPIGWSVKNSGLVKKDFIPQEATSEIIRDTMVMEAHNVVYTKGGLNEAVKGYLKDRGYGGTLLSDLKGFFQFSHKRDFMYKVKRAMIALSKPAKLRNADELEILNDANIVKGANAYADGFQLFAKKLAEAGVEEAQDLAKNTGRFYVPRKISFDSFVDLERRIGEDGVIDLLTGAIARKQPLINRLDNPIATPETIKVKTDITSPELVKLNKQLDKLKKKNRKIYEDARNKNELDKKDLTKKIRKENPDFDIAQVNRKVSQILSDRSNKKVQPLLDEIKKLEERIKKLTDSPEATIQKDVAISVTKAEALARAIVKMAKYNSRYGGFDIEQLVKIKDPKLLREYIDDVFGNLDQAQRDELFNGLQNQLKLITSGRFQQRIRLDENYEHTLTVGKAKGQRVRLDQIYENDIDLLWHSYTNEMSGWYALANRVGVKSRNEWLTYSNGIKRDIRDSYRKSELSVARKIVNVQNKNIDNVAIREEEAVIDSFFNNLMGRSTEGGDPSSGYQAWLRDLRRFNFIRVLNQVGIAQLPEFGVVTSQVGLRTMLNEIPSIRKIFDDAQAGNLPDTFRKDFAIYGASNGDDHLYRLHQSLEVLDRGAAKSDFQKGALLSKSQAAAAEKVTGYGSFLLQTDSLQRRLAMRGFVHNMAEDLIEGSKKGNLIDNISRGKLNRYRVLGLRDSDLVALAKEFNSPRVVKTKNALGYRVLSFDFVAMKDQELVKRLAVAVNRSTRRSVQYNHIGDTSRFFTDNTLGKTMSQFRQFIMNAWNKQFLHNVAMADMQTASMFLYTTMIGGLAYAAQVHFNSIGMSKTEKKKYIKKRLGDKGDYSKIARAAFQRAGWSSVMPPFMDMITGQLAPEHRFNTRSSGQEMNLITGNPTYDLVFGKLMPTLGAGLKSMRSDYEFSKNDFNRLMRILPYQNLYGINQLLNFIKDNSGLPDKGATSLY